MDSQTHTGLLLWLLLGAVIVAVSVAAFLYLSARRAPPPAVLATVPEFSLVDQSGSTVRRSDLLGKAWVATFMFTHCTQACPLMAAQFLEVQDVVLADERLRGRVRLVSFSIDPARDTPARLEAYGRNLGAEAGTWTFLTGEQGVVAALSRGGFGLAVGDDPAAAQASGASPVHSDRFVLVDAQGRIRGYYRPTAEKEEMEKLLRDLEEVVREAEENPEATEGR